MTEVVFITHYHTKLKQTQMPLVGLRLAQFTSVTLESHHRPPRCPLCTCMCDFLTLSLREHGQIVACEHCFSIKFTAAMLLSKSAPEHNYLLFFNALFLSRPV